MSHDFSEELPTIIGPKRKRAKKEEKPEEVEVAEVVEAFDEDQSHNIQDKIDYIAQPAPILPTTKLTDSHGNHMGQIVIYWYRDLGNRLIPCPMLLVTLNSNDSWQCQRFGDGMMNMYVTFATMYSEKPEHGCFTKIPKD